MLTIYIFNTFLLRPRMCQWYLSLNPFYTVLVYLDMSIKWETFEKNMIPWKKEMKLPLFAEYLIVYIENIKVPSKQLLKLSKFSSYHI